ncbi:MAG: hypothetical protein LUH01_07080 [Parabacteroides gordonii]|nr:hypothetical protein [Parabacteroides gordonii]
MKIVIENKEYKIKYSLRMYYTYEGITGTMFTGGTLLSVSLLFYSALLASNDDFPYTFDQFVVILDEDNTPLDNFNNWLTGKLEKRTPVEDKKSAEEKVIGVRELYRICVGRYGMDPVYFLDRVSQEEVYDYLEGAAMRERDAWERTRISSYIVARTAGCDAETAEEFLPLPWDESQDIIEESTEVDLDELRKLRESAKLIERELKDGRYTL